MISYLRKVTKLTPDLFHASKCDRENMVEKCGSKLPFPCPEI